VQFPKVRFLLSVAGAEQFPEDAGREVAFAGRSNAGKSSAINTILVRNGLARTSKTPGRTRLLNFFEVEPGRRIIDRSKLLKDPMARQMRASGIKLIEALPDRECIAGLFLIVDSRRGISESYEQLITWAESAGWQVHVLLAKADKLNQRDRAAALKDAESRLPEGMTAQIFSAHDKIGVEAAQKRLVEMLASDPSSKD